MSDFIQGADGIFIPRDEAISARNRARARDPDIQHRRRMQAERDALAETARRAAEKAAAAKERALQAYSPEQIAMASKRPSATSLHGLPPELANYVHAKRAKAVEALQIKAAERRP